MTIFWISVLIKHEFTGFYFCGLYIIHEKAKFTSLEICTSEKLAGIQVGEQPINKRLMNLILVMVALLDITY